MPRPPSRAGELVEPPQAEGGEQLALAGDARREHVVERAHAVARDDEHALGARRRSGVLGGHVQVAHLARVDVPPAGQFEGGVTRPLSRSGGSPGARSGAVADAAPGRKQAQSGSEGSTGEWWSKPASPRRQ